MKARTFWILRQILILVQAAIRIDAQAPGLRRTHWSPVRFLIEKVAPPANRLPDRHTRRAEINPLQKIELVHARVDEAADHRANNRALNCDAARLRIGDVKQQPAPDTGIVVSPLHKRAPLRRNIPGPRTRDAGDQAKRQKVPRMVGVVAMRRGAACPKPGGQDRAAQDADGVPMNGEQAKELKNKIAIVGWIHALFRLLCDA